MKVGPKSSLRPFLHRALQLFNGFLRSNNVELDLDERKLYLEF